MTSRLDESVALRYLKESAATEPGLPDAVEARLWSRVSSDVSALAVGSVVAASILDHGRSLTAPSTWLRLIGSRVALWAAPALAAGAAAGAAGHAVLSARSASSTRVAHVAQSAPASAPAASVAKVEPLPPELQPEQPTVAPRTPHNDKPASSVGGDPRPVNPLTRERALLDPARVALASGDAARALQQTKRHAQEFPKGLLSEEREAIAINALVILGNYAKARQRTEAFRANYPQSLQMHSIDAVMANVPKQ